MQRIKFGLPHALYDVKATRQIEGMAQIGLPPHTLMQRAGLAAAQLALAIAPHARRIWIACGPGNNGGDGLEAAVHLQHWGKSPVITWMGTPDSSPDDAKKSYLRAVEAGVTFSALPPPDTDLCIDALLGIGSQARAPRGDMADWIHAMNAGTFPILALDLPSGLNADTGVAPACSVKASHTLSLLTLKPGLFTSQGRDAAGLIWLDDLKGSHKLSDRQELTPTAWLAGQPIPMKRSHTSHKGIYGDVAVIGGATSMTGAALLAASAALHSGAGRVFVGLLDGGSLNVSTHQPELMFRPIDDLDLSAMTVVCGCGGGKAVHAHLHKILSTATHLVLDADALNSIASTKQFRALVHARGKQSGSTVLTPHPLEAARLLGITATQVQNDRLGAAQQLVQRFNCTVVLKGSGTIIAAPNQTPAINPTGNGRLATAGTGDVLAGMIGARLAAGSAAFRAACEAVYQHGLKADQWSTSQSLTAGTLLKTL